MAMSERHEALTESFSPFVARRREIAARKLRSALVSNKDAIAAQWMELIPEAERREQPDLERQLRSLLSGLCEIFDDGDWTLTQTIIDGLAERRGRRPGSVDNGFQRALTSGRYVMSRVIGPSPNERELLFETLHECVCRYYESYQDFKLASEHDRLHNRIIRSLVMALEARDQYTKGHSVSVALLSEKIAGEMGVDPYRAYLAGLLHDVGKVGVPDNILSKDAALTDNEWVIMRAHPIIGANILAPIKLYADVVDGVLAHHENWDGTGYPTGLEGSDIPVLGRIIRVADSLDAMTSTRAFRASRGIKEALNELDELSGISYDADVVTSLKQVLDAPGSMRELSLASLQIDLAANGSS
jgi:putative nucleotidyltransferase with HDIG domain